MNVIVVDTIPISKSTGKHSTSVSLLSGGRLVVRIWCGTYSLESFGGKASSLFLQCISCAVIFLNQCMCYKNSQLCVLLILEYWPFLFVWWVLENYSTCFIFLLLLRNLGGLWMGVSLVWNCHLDTLLSLGWGNRGVFLY